MTMNGLGDMKARLRTAARKRRDSIPLDERARLSEQIASRLLSVLDRLARRTVMLFSSFGSEVSTRRLIDTLASAGAQIALPVVEGPDMRAALFRPGDPTRMARYGAVEPASACEVPPDALDVVVVPGLVFDREGYRLGYGRGYYDRFLVRTRRDAPRIGIGFHVQLVEAVPHGDADQRMDAIVTEVEVLRCRPPRLPVGVSFPI